MGNKDSNNKGKQKSPEDDLFDQMFEFKTQAKEFKRQAAIAEKEAVKSKEKVKKSIQNGDMSSARIYADEAIRNTNQIRQYMVLSSKLDAVASRLNDAYKKQKLTSTMCNLTQKMNLAMKGMNLVEVNETMKGFEQIFDNLDINSQVMDKALESVGGVTAQDQKNVDSLIENIAKQHNLKLQDDFDLNVKNPNAVSNQVNVNQNVQNPMMNQQLYN
jgi:charged multivesicular body protein 1